MRKIVLVVLSFVMISPLFAMQRKHKKTKKTTNDIVSVEVYHTACFGRCPEYTIKVDKNGVVTYTGIRFTEDSGVFEKKIGKTKAEEILNHFKNAQVDTCKDRYESRIQDLPGVIMTIQYPSRSKRIINAHFGPPILKGLTNVVDKTWDKQNNPAGWKSVKPSNTGQQH